jgi:bifunctional DNase/RNase
MGEAPGSNGERFVEVLLSRIVIRDQALAVHQGQYIYLQERGGQRGFPMVIGRYEAEEIQRVVAGEKFARPLTHQLAFAIIKALGAELRRCDIVDLQDSTFFAQLVLGSPDGATTAVVDARPSDGIALAMRARVPIRVAESVLEQVRTDPSGPDPTPPAPEESE